jgi:hypothetical protein
VFGAELAAAVVELAAQGEVAPLEEYQRRAESEDQEA